MKITKVLKRSIRAKLIAFYVLLVLFVLGIHSFMDIIVLSKSYFKEKKTQTKQEYLFLKDRINSYLYMTKVQMLNIKDNIEMLGYKEIHSIKPIRGILPNYSHIFPEIIFISKNGAELLRMVKGKEVLLRKSEASEIKLLKQAMKHPNQLLFSSVTYSKTLKKYVIKAGISIEDNFGSFKGTLICSIPLSYMIPHNISFNGATVRVISSKTRVVEFSTIPKEIGKKMSIYPVHNLFHLLSKNLKPFKMGSEIEFVYQKPLFKNSLLIISYPEREFIGDLLSYLYLEILIFFIITAAAIVIAIKVSDKLISPIERITKYIKEVSKGNLTQTLEIEGEDEIKILAESINTTREKMISTLEMLRKKTKEAMEANKVKTTFLANMSHEIRTPLNAIIGFISILKENETDPQKLEYLKIMEKSANDLLKLLTDILDFSKIETGKIKIEKTVFNLQEELTQIIRLFEAKAKEKNLTIKLQTNNLPTYVEGDPLRIKQILSNLLSNAVKFSPEGKSITVTASYKDGNLHVSVKDEGIGIAKTDQNIIFKPFEQANAQSIGKINGTGLGLSISYNLARMMGGKLQVESEKNKGSNFYFSIPLKKTDLKKKEKTNLNDNPEKLFKNKKALVVDDNKSNRVLLSTILKSAGFKVDEAENGKEAIEKYKKNRYDVILMDENMPEMNGTEAAQSIKTIEKEKSLKHTPIIAITANAVIGDKERFLESGMDCYLPKPITKQKLLQILSELL